MILPYLARLACLSLAAFFLVHAALGMAVSALTPWAVRFAARVAPAYGARVLLGLRLFRPVSDSLWWPGSAPPVICGWNRKALPKRWGCLVWPRRRWASLSGEDRWRAPRAPWRDRRATFASAACGAVKCVFLESGWRRGWSTDRLPA